MRRICLALAIAPAIAACLPTSLNAAAERPNVDLLSCSVTASDRAGNYGNASEGILYVRFLNRENRVLTGLTWRVPFGTGYLTFTDRGTFSPGVSIDNGIVITGPGPRRSFQQDYFSLDRPQDCALIAAKWDDGTVWRDPSPAPTAPLPTIAPDSAPTEPSSFPNAANDPVGLLSCSLQANEHAVGVNGIATGLWVRFRNLSDKPLTAVTFRGHYGAGGFNFTDAGTFQPGVMVKHWIRRKVPPLPFFSFRSFDERASCDVLQATYADGTIWTNAATAQVEPPMPTPNPSGITKFEGLADDRRNGERPLEASTPPPQ